MAEQEKKQIKVSFDRDVALSGTYSNAVSVHVNQNEVVIDFGYSLPNASQPEILINSRVNLSHKTAESFVSVMQNALLDFRNKMKEANEKK